MTITCSAARLLSQADRRLIPRPVLKRMVLSERTVVSRSELAELPGQAGCRPGCSSKVRTSVMASSNKQRIPTRPFPALSPRLAALSPPAAAAKRPPNDVVVTTTRTQRHGRHNDVVGCRTQATPPASSASQAEGYRPGSARKSPARWTMDAGRLDQVVVAALTLGVYGSRRGSGKPRLV